MNGYEMLLLADIATEFCNNDLDCVYSLFSLIF